MCASHWLFPKPSTGARVLWHTKLCTHPTARRNEKEGTDRRSTVILSTTETQVSPAVLLFSCVEPDHDGPPLRRLFGTWHRGAIESYVVVVDLNNGKKLSYEGLYYLTRKPSTIFPRKSVRGACSDTSTQSQNVSFSASLGTKQSLTLDRAHD